MMPASPVEQWLTFYDLPHTEENIKIVTEKMGLDKPLINQYLSWIGAFLKGDWRTSLISGVSIKEQFMKKLPYSISIGLFGIIIAALQAFFIGYGAAVKPGGFLDRFSSFISVFSQSVPSFILSILIIYWFSIKLHLMSFFTGNGIAALITAIFITAFYSTGALSRVVCAAFREEMKKSYVKSAVSRGFERNNYILHHGYKPVLSRLIATITADFAWVFGGSTVLEFAFCIPGVSYFLVESMHKSDYNVIQTYVLVVIVWMFIVHLVLNLLLSLIDVRRNK